MNIPVEQKRKFRQFVKDNKQNLAALCLALGEEWGNTKDCLGIDFFPQPHFVRCSREAIETLNQKVDSKIQEILGILDGYKPNEEIAIIIIDKSQIELIHYNVESYSEELSTDIDSLIRLLETQMQKLIV